MNLRVGEGIKGAAAIAAALLTPFMQSRRIRWGATDAEFYEFLPGDDLVRDPKWRWTHAVTIGAAAADIWPWLVQIGQGRGGFYSYESLPNLIGGNIHNADRIIPELQHLAVGDSVRLHPRVPGLTVAVLEVGQALVLHVKTETLTESASQLGKMVPKKYFKASWLFFLEEIDKGVTRLISRWRVDYNPSLGNKLAYGPCFVEPIGFVMDRKMLSGIKERVERSQAAPATPEE